MSYVYTCVATCVHEHIIVNVHFHDIGIQHVCVYQCWCAFTCIDMYISPCKYVKMVACEWLERVHVCLYANL